MQKQANKYIYIHIYFIYLCFKQYNWRANKLQKLQMLRNAENAKQLLSIKSFTLINKSKDAFNLQSEENAKLF